MFNIRIILLSVIAVFILSFCNQTGNKKKSTYKISAYIDTIPITIDQVDRRVSQEIFDELNRIYMIRKIALEDLLKEELLSLEASKKGLTVDALLDLLYQHGLKNTKKL
jgi:hypothetical protein